MRNPHVWRYTVRKTAFILERPGILFVCHQVDLGSNGIGQKTVSKTMLLTFTYPASMVSELSGMPMSQNAINHLRAVMCQRDQKYRFLPHKLHLKHCNFMWVDGKNVYILFYLSTISSVHFLGTYFLCSWCLLVLTEQMFRTLLSISFLYNSIRHACS
jgi:hypothetical protein